VTKLPTSKNQADEYAHYVTYRISQLDSRMKSQATQLLRENCDLSIVQWRLIALVAGSKGLVTATRLANSIDMDPGQFSRTLKALIEEGLIIRSNDETDNRRQELRLSASGRSRFNKAEPIMKERRESLMKGISSADQAAFNRVLDQIENNVKSAKPGKSHAR